MRRKWKMRRDTPSHATRTPPCAPLRREGAAAFRKPCRAYPQQQETSVDLGEVARKERLGIVGVETWRFSCFRIAAGRGSVRSLKDEFRMSKQVNRGSAVAVRHSAFPGRPRSGGFVCGGRGGDLEIFEPKFHLSPSLFFPYSFGSSCRTRVPDS